MWIVRLALRRPYTFVVAALLLLLMTPFVLMKTPTDIFPSINIPVVSVIWQYTGLPADQIAQRIIYSEERALTTTVDNIEHIESTSYDSQGVIKVFFQPGVNPATGVAQLTAVSQTILKQLPPGTTPPLILQYSASTVSILQFGVSSTKLSEQQVFDIALNQIRVGLISVPGVSIPYPYGGKQRVVSVDLDLKALEANNLVESDVVTAISNGALTYPSGVAKIGGKEVPIDLNVSPFTIEPLNNLPIKSVGGTVIRISDVAQVRDGYMPQENIVRQDGVRSTLIQIFKNGSASTLSVAAGVKAAMAKVLQTVTSDVHVKQFADQSLFVSAAVSGVVREGVIAAALTALMILLFLGSWRSTLIIAVSIPLSVLASLAILSALGQTINIMTLGGLALAVGILVDDATVTIENVERHLATGEPLEDGILKGAGEIALPALVSTMCICIVFVPMFSLTGVARYLFVPLAEAVVFAVLASYAISRTLVPTMIMFFERHHKKNPAGSEKSADGRIRSGEHVPFWVRPLAALQHGFEKAFDRFRSAYSNLLGSILEHRVAFAAGFLAFCVCSWLLVPFLGQNFFPAVDAGTFRLHVRAPTGTRIEQTAKLVDEIETNIRRQIPAKELEGMIDNIGLPVSGINLSYNDSGVSGPADGDILVSLLPGHKPTANYVRNLRLSLNRDFPGITFYFLPADIVTETINFGLPAPLDIQVVGRDQAADQQVANAIAQKVRRVRGAVDVRVQQPNDLHRVMFSVDRTKAMQLGLSERDVAGSVLLALSGSSQVTPTYWLDPATGVQYLVNVRVPEPETTTLSDLKSTPISASIPGKGNGQLLENLADTSRTTSQPIYSHYNVMPVVDVFGNVGARDLGGVLADIKPIIAEAKKTAPRGTDIILRGQAATMSSSFTGLSIGMIMSIALIYLLLVVNFQSWLDPFIILTALTGALAGVIWGLHITGTTLSVPAMMGAIMCLGVATANSVLVVTFARTHLQEGMAPVKAAWEAGTGRLRPVIMTATAMVIGMLPMALGLGEGGEQNAPLGRAVIGGLIFATVATLLFVPVVFSLLHRQAEVSAKAEPKEMSHQPASMRPLQPKRISIYMSTTTYPGSVGPMADEPKADPVRSRRRFRRIIIVGGALLVIALVVGFIPQWRQRQTAIADTNQLAIPTVGVVTPALIMPKSGLNLPAEVKPWQEASIFARANGFLKSWLVDIGAHVEKDQLLAEIDTPDLAQQLAQARSQATLAQKSLEQAKSTNEKWQDLFHQGVVSELDSENMATSQATNQANTEAFAANLRFLEQEFAFQRVTAPFAGTITVRNTNVGDLITANNTGTGMEMFHIQQRDPLRVYFRVPQPEAPNIAAGQTFNVQIGAESAKTYPGKVVTTSKAVSPDSRTMLVELQVDNSKNEILPGSYAVVRLPANVLGKLLILPDNTLIFRGKNLQVGVVDAKGVVQLRDVEVGRDFGIQSEIISGVTESDKIIVNPSDSLTTGAIVHVAATPAPAPSPAPAKK